MGKKYFISFLEIMFACISLFAEPSIVEVEQAIKANPALLDTPQAKAEMAKRGITKEQVQQKLNSNT